MSRRHAREVSILGDFLKHLMVEFRLSLKTHLWRSSVIGSTRPARWAVSLFGRESSTALTHRLPAAMQAAVGRQMDAQQISRVKTLHPFGGAWPARYEELASHLQDVPGVDIVRPAGRAFEIVLVNNVVLIPFEYAKDLRTNLNDRKVMRKLNRMTLELLEQYGPEPTHQQPSIDGLPVDAFAEANSERPDLLRGLSPDGVVVVYYAADHRLGLLRIGWGELVLNPNRTPVWKRTQDLTIPAATPIPGINLTPALSIRDNHRVVRFDEAPMPSPAISPRPASEAATPYPVTEQAPAVTPIVRDHG
jgi:hypothetical protein